MKCSCLEINPYVTEKWFSPHEKTIDSSSYQSLFLFCFASNVSKVELEFAFTAAYMFAMLSVRSIINNSYLYAQCTTHITSSYSYIAWRAQTMASNRNQRSQMSFSKKIIPHSTFIPKRTIPWQWIRDSYKIKFILFKNVWMDIPSAPGFYQNSYS